MSDCTAPVPANAITSKINVALLPTDGAGICGANGCFVPLDNDPSDGWTVKDGRLQLPLGLCDLISNGLKATVAVSTDCTSKTPAVPTCGPWSAEGGDGGSASGGATTGDASAGSGQVDGSVETAGDAGACGANDLSTDGGACNQIANVGSQVTPTCASGTPPTMTGGSIEDGTYVMTAVMDYGCADGGEPVAPPQAQTWVVSGGCLQGVETVTGESASMSPDGSTMYDFSDGGMLAITQSLAVQGSELVLTQVCGADAGQTREAFTATPTKVTTVTQDSLGTMSVQVFTKK
jgi:hypothetical protein